MSKAAKPGGWLRSYVSLLLPNSMRDKYGPDGFSAAWERARESLEAGYALYHDKAAEKTQVLCEMAALRHQAEASIMAVGAEMGLSGDEALTIGEKLYLLRQEGGL